MTALTRDVSAGHHTVKSKDGLAERCFESRARILRKKEPFYSRLSNGLIINNTEFTNAK